MNFLETLKSVGGVKPCPKCAGSTIACPTKWAYGCHGTGQILDLAPLLAKPKELVEAVTSLRGTFAASGNGYGVFKQLHVVGPQRAHSLVYEVARQLGGTAVVAIPTHSWVEEESLPQGYNGEWLRTESGFVLQVNEGYRLSLPIPPDATVLFVTGRVDEHELRAMAADLFKGGVKILPYLLALVTSVDSTQILPSTELKVISLHQEKA